MNKLLLQIHLRYGVQLIYFNQNIIGIWKQYKNTWQWADYTYWIYRYNVNEGI